MPSLLAASKNGHPTILKTIHKARGFTQQLSDASGVTLRTKQLYEQRRNNINEAAIASVRSLASALGCQMTDLLEPDP